MEDFGSLFARTRRLLEVVFREISLEPAAAGIDRSYLERLNELIGVQGEVLVALSAVSPDRALPWRYFLATSLEDILGHLTDTSAGRDVVDVAAFRSPQLPIRGRADDVFLRRAQHEVPDGSPWLLVLLDEDMRWAVSGATHDQLRTTVATVSGREAAFGIEPTIPIGDASSVLPGLIDLAKLADWAESGE